MESSRTEPAAPLELVPGGTRDEASSVGDSSELSPRLLEVIAADAPLLPTPQPLGARLASAFGRHHLALFVACFLCLWAILTLPPFLSRPEARVGETAPRDYLATQNTFVRDRIETENRRAAAAALVTPAYNPDSSALALALAELPYVEARVRETLEQSASEAVTSNAALAVVLGERMNVEVAPEAAAWLAAVSRERWNAVGDAGREAVRQVYVTGRIRSDVATDIEAVRPILRGAVETFRGRVPLSDAEKEAAIFLATRSARFPNVVVDQAATDDARRAARASVLPVYQRVEANTPIVRSGERISAVQWEQLQELELIAPEFNPGLALAHGALCLMLVASAAIYISRSRLDIVERPAALWLVAAIPVVFVFAFRLILPVPHTDLLMIPLAATAAMLVTVLLDARLGWSAGFVVAALCALMARAEAGLFLAATLSAWIGALCVARLATRFSLVRAIGVLAIANAFLAAALGVLRDTSAEEIISSMGWSALAGVGSVVAMAALAIFLERPFGITSHLRLLELLSPDEALLRRMQVEAPGTYTHSMLVAALAEAAAKEIGADSLLCRVAATYHDIGKLRRPGCFIENQAGENVHEKLSPSLSALLIKAHVADGIKLGRSIRLPEPVLEIIAAHHGKTLVSFFYHRARVAQGESVDEALYRYPGPRPRSREAAIVLLADSIEASARSLGSVTPESLERHVHHIVRSRLSEGELSECELSLREITALEAAFTKTLRGAMHGRIAYPDPATLEQENDDWIERTLSRRPRPAPHERAAGASGRPRARPGVERRKPAERTPNSSDAPR